MHYRDEDDTVIEMLFDLIRAENVERAERLLKANPELVHRANGDCVGPMHAAAAIGSLDMVKMLRKHGANPNAVDILGLTPIFQAVAIGSLPIVQELIAAGANAAHVSETRVDIISVAVAYGHFDIVKYVQAFHPRECIVLSPQRRLTILTACWKGNADAVLYFTLFRRSDIDQTWPYFENINPLGLAVVLGDIELVQLLIDLGASPTIRSMKGMSALDICIQLERGNDIKACLTRSQLSGAQVRIDKRIEVSPLRSVIASLSPKPLPKPRRRLLSSYSQNQLQRIFSYSSSTSSDYDSGICSLVGSVSEQPSKMRQ
ncbi:hypothetical protein L596_016387 [Steinernema carpocapsae]|uniref:Uncharacterized protein n=1 Tax=Steinernema carpocapsae TaxID=34508 RepID=A0A4U5NJ06_STECR|nr:hypothetical protein L596_016387 [Steinernema carpocapsae]